ncbi:MAG TPA: transglutaminaseTgpA domain-containing protein, partial [Candidatus Limnocylindrales bacterium]
MTLSVPARIAPEELPAILRSLPRRPTEGWLTLGLVVLMTVPIAWSIDDARWVLGRDNLTDFLMWVTALGVLWGFVSAKAGWPRWQAHVLGAVFAALLVPILVGMTLIPSGGSVHDWFIATASSSVEAYLDLAWRGRALTQQYGHFLLVLGLLVWATGQFAGYAVFGHRRPLAAVLVSGLVLLTNMSITIKDQLPYLVVFTLAALLLLIRLHAVEERTSWLRHRIGDPATVAGLYLRGGSVFVTVAVVGALVLTGTASSAPLAGAWSDIDQRLIDFSQGIQRFLPRGGGGSRISGVSFGPNTAITGRWVTDDTPALKIRVPLDDDTRYYWRAVTYDHFELGGWSFSETSAVVREANVPLLDDLPEDVSALDGRRQLKIVVEPLAFRGSSVFSPGVPISVSEATHIDLVGPGLYLGGIDATGGESSYSVEAAVPIIGDSAPGGLTENRLRAAGQDYPEAIKRLYLDVPEGSIGPYAKQLLTVLEKQTQDANPYDLARATETMLRSKAFSYNADVTGIDCHGESVVECFARVRQGYCQYYASTMAILLREEGVPTRVVQGFLPGPRDPRTGEELIRYSNSHAWVEVYFPDYGWVDFDPTGGGIAQLAPLPSGRPVPSASHSASPGSSQLDPNLLPSRRDDPEAALGGGALGRNSGPGTGPYIAIAILLLLAVAGLGFLAWQRGPRGPIHAEGVYRSIAALAGRFGYGPRPTQTAYEYAGALGEILPAARPPLQVVADAKVEVAYGRRTLSPSRLV